VVYLFWVTQNRLTFCVNLCCTYNSALGLEMLAVLITLVVDCLLGGHGEVALARMQYYWHLKYPIDANAEYSPLASTFRQVGHQRLREPHRALDVSIRSPREAFSKPIQLPLLLHRVSTFILTLTVLKTLHCWSKKESSL
jgi:hypothetical protein